jgi:hypothetical protein
MPAALYLSPQGNLFSGINYLFEILIFLFSGDTNCLLGSPDLSQELFGGRITPRSCVILSALPPQDEEAQEPRKMLIRYEEDPTYQALSFSAPRWANSLVDLPLGRFAQLQKPDRVPGLDLVKIKLDEGTAVEAAFMNELAGLFLERLRQLQVLTREQTVRVVFGTRQFQGRVFRISPARRWGRVRPETICNLSMP